MVCPSLDVRTPSVATRSEYYLKKKNREGSSGSVAVAEEPERTWL